MVLALLILFNWFQIQFLGKNVGYSNIKEEENKVKEITSMKLKALGEERSVSVILSWEKGDDFSMRSAEFVMESKGTKTKIISKVEGDNFVVIVGDFQRKYPIRKVWTGSFYYFILKEIKEKGGMIFDYFDHSVLLLDKARIEYVGEEGNMYVFRKTFGGMSSKIYASKDFKVLKEEMPGGMVLISADKEKALKIEGVDVILSSAIKSPQRIVKNAKYLKVKIQGVEFIDTKNQKITKDKNTIIVERYYPPYYKSKEDLSLYLQKEELINPDDPEIVKVANLFRGKSGEDAIRGVVDWVFKNLEKTSSLGMPSSYEVIRQRKGDCNEHAILAVTILRALKIPSRVVFGIVYEDGYFFYHAWAEAYIKEKDMWVEFDPVFGLYPADIARIRIGYGNVSEWMKVLDYVGKVKILSISN